MPVLYTAVSIFWVFYQPGVSRNNVFRSHHSPGNVLHEWITKRGRRFGYLHSRRIKCACSGLLRDHDMLPARWLCMGPAGAHQHLLAPSSSGLVLQDPSWLLLHYYTALRFWEGLLVLELIQLRVLPPRHHWHRFCAVPKIPPKTADSWLCTHGQFICIMMHTLCYFYNSVSKTKRNKIQFNVSLFLKYDSENPKDR